MPPGQLGLAAAGLGRQARSVLPGRLALRGLLGLLGLPGQAAALLGLLDRRGPQGRREPQGLLAPLGLLVQLGRPAPLGRRLWRAATPQGQYTFLRRGNR